MFSQAFDDGLQDDGLSPLISHALVFRTDPPVLLSTVVIHLETVVGGFGVEVSILDRVDNAYIFTALSHFDFIHLGVIHLVQLQRAHDSPVAAVLVIQEVDGFIIQVHVHILHFLVGV